MKRSKSQHSQRRRQERLVVFIGVAIIATSIITTLWYSGVLWHGNDQPGYKNVTFTDALLQCEKEIKTSYGKQLRSLTFDNHSSRFDVSSYQYKVFFKAQMGSATSAAGASDFYLNCFVSAERGKIASLDAYEKKESQTEAIRKDEGGIFGWP